MAQLLGDRVIAVFHDTTDVTSHRYRRRYRNPNGEALRV